MGDIILSSGVRQNLLSLQDTAALMAKTQNRLATGKKVNSALDNPINFFTSQGLSNRASDLNSLLDAIGQGQQTLQAANTGLTSLTSLVQSAKSIATQALQSTLGTVNYTNITGTNPIALDNTVSTTATAVAGTGTASTYAHADINSSGLAQLLDGNTLTYKLGTGATITATFTTGATNTATNTFADAAGLISVLNSGTGASGNFGATATAASDGSGGVTVTGKNLTDNFVLGGTHPGLTTNFSKTDVALGDALTINDGFHTSTFYRVASGATAAQGTYTTAADLVAAVNHANSSVHTLITASTGGTNLVLTGGNGTSITVGGTGGAALGFGAPAALNNNNTTLGALSGTVSLTVGTNAANTLTFGSGPGQIHLKSQLDAALATITNITASTNGSGNINFAPTSSDDVTVGGTASVLTALGLSAGTTTPVATVVSPSATRTSVQNQFNALLLQIDQLAKDSSYNGVNLIYGDNLKVTFNEDGSSSLTINSVKFDSTGLGLNAIAGSGFQDNHVIDSTLKSIEAALTKLRAQASTFGSTLTTVQTRQDFTKHLINVLQTGSDDLVLADTNEEGANLLALQTRQSLSTTALSLANQSNQAVLKLFG